MRTAVAQLLFTVGRGLRKLSYFVGALAGLAVIVSPFVASSFTDWLRIVGTWFGIALGTWLIVFRCLPTLLARAAIAVLPEDQLHLARSEQAVWAYENLHGPLAAEERAELRKALVASDPVTDNRKDGHMDFQSEAHEAAYKLVKDWLRQMFGEAFYESDEKPEFACAVENDRNVFVMAQPLGEQGGCVNIYAWPLGDTVRAPDGALRPMLEMNSQYRFGSLNIQPGGSIVFEYYVSSEGLTFEEFRGLFWAIAAGADQIRDALAAHLVA